MRVVDHVLAQGPCRVGDANDRRGIADHRRIREEGLTTLERSQLGAAIRAVYAHAAETGHTPRESMLRDELLGRSRSEQEQGAIDVAAMLRNLAERLGAGVPRTTRCCAMSPYREGPRSCSTWGADRVQPLSPAPISRRLLGAIDDVNRRFASAADPAQG